jgi:AbiV family abortive infection protein
MDYQRAIGACVDNGKRLVRDAELLRDDGSHSTALAIAILAEEEFAKAFLLFLIQDQALPSTPEVWRALRDHYCKHLLRVWMEYLDADVDDFIGRVRMQYNEDELPRAVAGAVNLFRHERVRKWEQPDFR